jgi:hypothetical protein
MSFEHKVYKELWTGLPGPGSKIKTPEGNYIVLSMDVANEAIRCHKPSGGDVVVPITSFGEFKQTVASGGQWEPQEENPPEGRAPVRPCGPCRRSLSERTRISEASRPSETGERRASRPAVRTSEGQKASGGDDAAAAERRRQNRGRGHRGGRRHKPEAEVSAAGNNPERSGGGLPANPADSAGPADVRRADRRSQPQVMASDTDDSGERAKPQGSRHRRRRPRKSPPGPNTAE